MDKEILLKMRNILLHEQTKNDALDRALKEKEELEQNPIVKRYIEVLKISEENNKRGNRKNKKTILDEEWAKNIDKVQETNNIFMYLGQFYGSLNDPIFGGKDLTYPTIFNNLGYNRYINIENPKNIRKVALEDCKEFEKEHTVIHPNSLLQCPHEYYEISKDFFFTAVTESEEAAIQKVLKKYNKN